MSTQLSVVVGFLPRGGVKVLLLFLGLFMTLGAHQGVGSAADWLRQFVLCVPGWQDGGFCEELTNCKAERRLTGAFCGPDEGF